MGEGLARARDFAAGSEGKRVGGLREIIVLMGACWKILLFACCQRRGCLAVNFVFVSVAWWYRPVVISFNCFLGEA